MPFSCPCTSNCTDQAFRSLNLGTSGEGYGACQLQDETPKIALKTELWFLLQVLGLDGNICIIISFLFATLVFTSTKNGLKYLFKKQNSQMTVSFKVEMFLLVKYIEELDCYTSSWPLERPILL